MFKRRYPGAKVTTYKIRKLYYRFKIKKKQIQATNIPTPLQREKILLQAVELAQDVSMDDERRFRIIQIDEFYITKNTMPTHTWSLPRNNTQLDNKEYYDTIYAVILAVSRERGVEHIEVNKKSITKVKFQILLQNLRSKYWLDDIMIMMDQLSLHTSNATKELMNELNFMYTFTPVYQPQYNGIEEVINIGKQKVRKKRLDMIETDEREDLGKVIYDCFRIIDPH